jgi:hypothetical protein
VPLPELETVARRVRLLRRTATPAPVEATPAPVPVGPRDGPAVAVAGVASPPDERRGGEPPSEVAALRDLVAEPAEGPGDRADRARRNASLYLQERRRRLRRELGGSGAEDQTTGRG